MSAAVLALLGAAVAVVWAVNGFILGRARPRTEPARGDAATAAG
jgi:hypothetical protein